ncbi:MULTISPECIES: SDR family NAD(P)-dependent oxidoreductase [Novosphingobium]|jgi:NAD(P)-dependent dehydrogenase (short-subunit alcohol dehydrogenase family)|uniref:Short-chain dehydrogenase/reductase SDR n=1 Tax=Novosphingobium subterraneum TaxID=48936 RepID=A0A0B9AFW6_9SPHN|nr:MULTISPECIES: SDR family NAD(P)-dependent oxidoreductase [Novosphingobium]KHS48205.1 short-chain dehydrogenase/reductase SDR [Novosphingobium subterraneum]
MRFNGKTVVVTGAASGIGRASAIAFAAEGATVYAADIDEAGLLATASASNGKVVTARCDVTRCEDIKALMDRAAAETGGIDSVFNNAGAGGDRAPIDEIEPEGWDRTMDLLLRSVAFGIRYAVPHMIGRKGASFVNTSSVAAVGPGYSPTAYAVAKAGVLHLTKVAAADLAKHQIRVNAVQPGFINTNIFTASLDMPAELEAQAKGAIAAMSQQAQPVARGGQPDDIAQAVLFLASEAAGFVTGTSLIVDGGITIGPRHSWDPNMPGLFDALQQMVDSGKAA